MLRSRVALVSISAVVLMGLLAGTSSARPNPPGNNGTVKVDGLPFSELPNNEPHVGCWFQIKFFGYDEGDMEATATLRLKPPTPGTGIDFTKSVFIGEDPAGGGRDLDARILVQDRRGRGLARGERATRAAAPARVPREAHRPRGGIAGRRHQAQGVLDPLPRLAAGSLEELNSGQVDPCRLEGSSAVDLRKPASVADANIRSCRARPRSCTPTSTPSTRRSNSGTTRPCVGARSSWAPASCSRPATRRRRSASERPWAVRRHAGSVRRRSSSVHGWTPTARRARPCVGSSTTRRLSSRRSRSTRRSSMSAG